MRQKRKVVSNQTATNMPLEGFQQVPLDSSYAFSHNHESSVDIRGSTSGPSYSNVGVANTLETCAPASESAVESPHRLGCVVAPTLLSDTCLPFVPGMPSHTGPITDVPVEAIAVDGSVSTFYGCSNYATIILKRWPTNGCPG